MGRRSKTGGVRPHGGGIQLRFTWRNREWRPTLQLRATPANLKHAMRMRAEIVAAIRAGTFDYSAWFPDARNAPQSDLPSTFGDYASRWLLSIDELAEVTRLEYSRILNVNWLPDLRDRPIQDIRYSDLVEVLAKSGASGKTRNNILIPVRRVFDFALLDRAISVNPAAAIRNSKVQRQDPDPLELSEVDLVLADLGQHHGPQIANYFAAAIFAGFRPSEQISLQWSDIDFVRRTARVERARVWGKDKNTTKTHTARDVELTDRALEAFTAQKEHTLLTRGAVFHNPKTRRPWNDEQVQRRCWNASLKRCGLRHREAYQTRHTFATLALMAGANPMWVARQLGHRSMKMLLEVYGKWIDAADRGRERAKLDAGFRTKPAQKTEIVHQPIDSAGGEGGIRTRVRVLA